MKKELTKLQQRIMEVIGILYKSNRPLTTSEIVKYRVETHDISEITGKTFSGLQRTMKKLIELKYIETDCDYHEVILTDAGKDYLGILVKEISVTEEDVLNAIGTLIKRHIEIFGSYNHAVLTCQIHGKLYPGMNDKYLVGDWKIHKLLKNLESQDLLTRINASGAIPAYSYEVLLTDKGLAKLGLI